MEKIVGQAVIYVDTYGKELPALVTNDWRGGQEFGALNVAFINMDPNQTDGMGQKIGRSCSVVHKSQQTAHGNYWKHVNET